MPSFSVKPTSIPTREVDRAEEAAVRAEVAAEKVGQTIDLATQLIKDVADAREEMIPITSQIESIPGVVNAAVNTINNTRTEAVQSINTSTEMAQEGISMQTTGALSAISSQETSSRGAVMTAGMNELGNIAQAKTNALAAIDTAKSEAIEAIEEAGDPTSLTAAVNSANQTIANSNTLLYASEYLNRLRVEMYEMKFLGYTIPKDIDSNYIDDTNGMFILNTVGWCIDDGVYTPREYDVSENILDLEYYVPYNPVELVRFAHYRVYSDEDQLDDVSNGACIYSTYESDYDNYYLEIYVKNSDVTDKSEAYAAFEEVHDRWFYFICAPAQIPLTSDTKQYYAPHTLTLTDSSVLNYEDPLNFGDDAEYYSSVDGSETYAYRNGHVATMYIQLYSLPAHQQYGNGYIGTLASPSFKPLLDSGVLQNSIRGIVVYEKAADIGLIYSVNIDEYLGVHISTNSNSASSGRIGIMFNYITR